MEEDFSKVGNTDMKKILKIISSKLSKDEKLITRIIWS